MRTIQFCLKILSNYIKGKKFYNLEESIDWDLVINYFLYNEMLGIMYYQCNDIIPDKYKSVIERRYASELFYYNNRTWIGNKLKSELMNNDIEFMIVKGETVASFYPQPFLRTMGDIDLVVHTNDRENVDKILRKIGFDNTGKTVTREWQYYYNNMELELHDRLVYCELTDDNEIADFFNGFWNYEKDGVLDWSFHFLFLIYHMRKHFMSQGIGIRHFFDIAILTKFNDKLNWTWIEHNLKKLNMWEFSQRIFFLNNKWFGVVPALDIKDFDKEFLRDASIYLFRNGVFGYNNINNRFNYTINGIRKTHKQSFGIRRVVTLLFPSYETMCKVDRYSFVCNRRYLLPFAWIYRIVKALNNKLTREKMNRTIKSSFVPKKKVQERAEILRKWGLE